MIREVFKKKHFQVNIYLHINSYVQAMKGELKIKYLCGKSAIQCNVVEGTVLRRLFWRNKSP